MKFLVALLLASVGSPVTAAGLGLANFTSLVVFGDSYTDQGVYQYRPDANGNVGRPSNTRSTGGRVWSQYVSQYTGAYVYDYAVSGAVCTTALSSTRNGVRESQMPNFLADNSYRYKGTDRPVLDIAADETVYSIWIGTNDLAVFLSGAQPAGMPLSNYSACVYEQLERLYDVGARKFVLLNLAPLDLSPQYALAENGGVTDDPQRTAAMREYLDYANDAYQSRTAWMAANFPGTVWANFDVHALITDMYQNPAEYLNGTVTPNVKSSIQACGSACSSSDVRDSYLWYDALHPSEQTDRIVAREFVRVVTAESDWARYWNA